MFGLGPMEIGIIVLIAVLLFGNRLPKLMRSLGSSLVEFKKGAKGFTEEFDDVKSTVRNDMRDAEREVTGAITEVSSQLKRATDFNEHPAGGRT